MTAKTPNGFVLIELVTTLILVGFIGAFVGLFLHTGINGFLASKRNSEAALKAQFALDRLSVELRRLQSLPTAPVLNTSIRYQSQDFPGVPRRISYNTGTISLSPDDGTTWYPLLDQVASFTLGWTPADMDQLDGDEEIREISIDFTLADVPKTFSVRIYPRTFIPKPS
jgi:hypothetical protein